MDSADALYELITSAWIVAPIPSIIYHKTGSAVAINSAARRMFRLTPDDLAVAGQNYNVLQDQSLIESGVIEQIRSVFMHPEGRETVDVAQYALRDNQGRLLGSTITTEITLIPLRIGDTAGDYIAAYYRDVASELGLQEQLKAKQQSLSEVQQVQSMLLVEIEARSAPVIPVFHGILVLPLIGAIDSQRAQQIIESTLEQATQRSTETLIMDITGVPMVDTQVANYLLQAIGALRLVGTETVLVGIGPEIAQTMVQLGLRLDEITTRADLQSGLEWALKRQGLAVLPLPGTRGRIDKGP